MINKQSLEKIVNDARDKLIKTYNPLAIYIFGSYAWGCPDGESNLDLLVVVDTEVKDRYRAFVEGHRALVGLPVPKDILLLSQKEFEQASERTSSLHYKIKRQGKKIYARA
jgi:uncharacterized protein